MNVGVVGRVKGRLRASIGEERGGEGRDLGQEL